MNITPQNTSLPLATVVNPQTDSLRRDNINREMISQPAAASQSAAEKGVASDKDKAKTPAQQNEQIDFTGIRKRAEEDDTTINGSSQEQHSQSGDQQSGNNQQSDKEASLQPNESVNNKETKQVLAEEKIIDELSARDAEVKRHENAHASTGGSVTGSPSYEYRKGPDGKSYAVSGEVSVDLSTVAGDPGATIAKMQQVHAAALAPTNPSSQDIKVAATAAKIILEAQSELMALALARESVAEKNNSDSASAADKSEYHDNEGNEFDQFINQTLKDQEELAPSRSEDVIQRAGRVENFYLKINKAYEQVPSNNFQLTA